MECVGEGVCPSCQAELAARRPVAPVLHRPIVAVAIIAICVAVYGLSTVSAEASSLFIGGGVQQRDLVAAGEWWRVLSAAFLHASLTHLLFNMWALYVLGVELERRVGALPFAALYLAAAAGGGVTYQVLGGPAPAVGASGAIFGLFGVWLNLAVRRRNSAWGKSLLSQLGFILLINAALPLIFPAISWQAHLGGFITGFLIGEAWSRVKGPQAERYRAAVGVIVAFAAIAIVLVV